MCHRAFLGSGRLRLARLGLLLPRAHPRPLLRGKGAGNVYELTREGKQVRKLEIPGERAEGLALDGFGRAFIADDAGGVLRVDP